MRDHARRHAGHHRAGDVAGDHGIRADRHVVTDVDAADDPRAGTEEDAVADDREVLPGPP
jgi:hypothetical protein